MKHVFANITSPKSRIALQVARKIAPCDRALNESSSGKSKGHRTSDSHKFVK